MSYDAGITTTPGGTLENTIKPAADTAAALQIQQHSSGQSGPLLSFYDAAGTTFLGGIGPNASAVWKGLALNVTPRTTNYTTLGTDYYIPVDATAGAVTITLKPSTGTPFGSQQRVTKVDSSVNAVTVQRGGSDTINGGTSITLTSQYDTAVLQSDGAGAWNAGAVPSTMLSAAVILAPGSDTRNRIQPTADFIPLSVEQFAGQTHDLFVAYASDGTTKLTRLTSNGTISSPGAGASSEHFGLSAAAAGANAASFGSTASATGDNSAALGMGALATGSASIAIGHLAVANGTASMAIGRITSSSHDAAICLGILATSTATKQLVAGCNTGVGFNITQVFIGSGVTDPAPTGTVYNGTGGSGSNIAGANLTFAGGRGTGSAVGGDLIFQSTYAGGVGSSLNTLHELARLSQLGILSLTQLTSVQDRTALDMTPSWATSTDASRKARAVFNIWDTAAREALRLEASGSAAMLGFFGATAVVRPASTDDLRQALINLGLYTTGGASPLDLNGGNLTAAGLRIGLAAKTANYTLVDADHTVTADATGGVFTVTLPTASGRIGKQFTVKRINSGANAVTLQGNGAETIDGSNTQSLGSQWSSLTVEAATSTTWIIV